MKHLILSSFVVLSSFALGACDLNTLLGLAGAPARECPDEGSRGTMTAQIGGEDFEACNSTAAGGPNASIVLNGISGDVVPVQLLITVATVPGTGTFEFGGDNGNGDTSASIIDSNEMLTGDESEGTYTTESDTLSGSIEFTAVSDTQVTGTFSFTGTRESDGATREVTNGAFDISF